jgi:beta-glucanase (GH16 family)
MKLYTFLTITSVLLSFYNKAQLDVCDFRRISIVEDLNLCNENPWIQVFEENFNGTTINSSVWKTDPQLRCRISNPERQYYQSENATVNNGILDIKVEKENEVFYAKTIDYLDNYELIPNTSFINLQPFQYTSADIETIKRFPNGKFEALIKIPKGKGLWPAFWLYNGDPNYNELDIFEFWSDNDEETQYKRIRTNSYRDYFNNGTKYVCSNKLLMFDFSFDYVKYTVVWDKSKIEWSVNDILFRTERRYFNVLGQEICNISAFETILEYMAFPNHPMNIILNVAVKNDKYKPNETDLFPKSMLVDWVKFYVRSDCSDKNITNVSQFPISSQDYNYLVGDNIIIDCVYNLPQDNQLVIVANNSVTLNPGFTTELGSEFNVRIDPSVCTTSELSPNNNTLNSDTKEKNLRDELDFTIFPNPSTDLININFTKKMNESIEVKVKDVNGIEVLNKVLYKSNEIDISNLSAGYYFLEIYDKTNKKFIHKNFIKL